MTCGLVCALDVIRGKPLPSLGRSRESYRVRSFLSTSLMVLYVQPPTPCLRGI